MSSASVRPTFKPWLCISLMMVSMLCLSVVSGSLKAADIVDALPFKDHAQEVRFQKLTQQLRCLVCQDESLAASGADLAKQMRGIVFDKMQQGWSDDEIKQYLVDRYSDYVLYKPPVHAGTWLLWFGPLVFLLIGATIVIFTIRARRRDDAVIVAEMEDDDEW